MNSPIPIRRLEVGNRPTSVLVPYANNARTHPEKQIRKIADSLRTYGWTLPILIDAQDNVIAGHARLAAAKLLGLAEVPTIRLEGLTEQQKRAYILADNRLAESAAWDGDLLAIEFQGLIEGGFDIELTGFEMSDVDRVLGCTEDATEEEPVALPDSDVPTVSHAGDLWHIEQHRIYCGDAREAESFERLLGNDRAAMVFADGPYNLRIQGHVSGLGNVVHREFGMASGEMSSAEFTSFQRTVMKQLVTFSVDGSIHYQCMDWRHVAEILDAAKGVYSELKNLCVWNKTNAGMSAFYRSKHELIFVFKSGRGPHINNFGLGDKGRHRTNVWDYPGVNTFRRGRMADLESHPTCKPIALVADAILDCSRRGDIVLDPFSGSGTTLLGAVRTGRRGAAMEIDPAYVDLAVRRLEKATGQLAVHGDGETFAHKASIRSAKEDLDVQR
jgi:DNA modification methylase